MQRGRTPRLDEVAALAGVSTATVSRFFNNPDLVAPATAERIRTAVAQTDYVPNLMAGALASQKSRLAAIFVPNLANSLFAATIEAMAGQLAAEGLTVTLSLTGSRDEYAVAAVEMALARRADAIFVTGTIHDQALRERLRRSSATVIECWDLPDEPIDVAVGFSHHAVGIGLARFLMTRGYRRPHLLSTRGLRAAHRREGFLGEWAAMGGATPSDDSVELPANFGQGRASFHRLREVEPRPDVVVCGSDALAQGLIVEAAAAGLRTPQDLAVVGFGNAPIAADMRPSITTVDIDGARIAREAVALMHRRAAAKGEFSERMVDVGYRLIARESA